MRFLVWIRIAATGAITALVAMPAQAMLIVPTFDASFANATSGNDPNEEADLETAIDTAITAIDGLYGNTGTVPVLFELNAGVNGESDTANREITYSQYTSLLTQDAAANPTNGILATALSNLPTGAGVQNVDATTSLLQVGLGVAGITPCFNGSGTFVNGCNQSYDAVVSIGNLNTHTAGPGFGSQAVATVEHELDEVLGGGGAGSTLNDTGVPTTEFGPTDLYRYAGNGDCNPGDVTTTISHTTSGSAISCYSIDGGKTSLVQFNQNSGGDFGDFVNTSTYIQEWAWNGDDPPVYTTASPEYEMMLSIGYDTIPEPSALALFAAALGALGWVRRRARSLVAKSI